MIQSLSDVFVYIDSLMFNCHMAWSTSSEHWVWLYEAGNDPFKDDGFFVWCSQLWLQLVFAVIHCNPVDQIQLSLRCLDMWRHLPKHTYNTSCWNQSEFNMKVILGINLNCFWKRKAVNINSTLCILSLRMFYILSSLLPNRIWLVIKSTEGSSDFWLWLDESAAKLICRFPS